MSAKPSIKPASILKFFALILAASAIIVTFILVTNQTYQKWLLAAWTLLPPIWFWLEYFVIRPPTDPESASFDRYKYGQELSRNVWAAVVALLLVLYFHHT